MPLPAGLLRFVNVFQGTDSHPGFSTGNTLPLVAVPFGSNHWSTQTAEGRWFFSPRDRWTQGIRCTHQPSPWMSDYGHFVVMAATGPDLHLSPRRRARAYQAETYPHRTTLELLNDGTKIQMAPTVHGAVFEFSFPDGGGAVLLEPCVGDAEVEVRDARTIAGCVRGNSGGVPEGFGHYFVARFDRDARTTSAFKGDEKTDDVVGERLGFVAEFDASVTMRIATSFISIEQAERNLETEIGEATVDEIALRAEMEWEAALGRIQVKGEERRLRTFYSCLYRTQLFPRVWHEETPEGRRHRSPYDGKVHEGVLYTDNGFWDTYRTIYPLFALLQPERLAEILQGWTNAYKEGGWFPQWATPGYRACMVGTHIDAVMADGVARGITDFDVDTALEGLLKHSEKVGDPDGAWGRIGIEDYLARGYVSTDHHESVARSLDYSYDDWCIAQVVEFRGRDASKLLERAGNYRHLYDPEVGFMRGRNADGTWLEPWHEFHWGSPYVEGGPWQSSWAVQHDPAGLIRLMGGEEAFVAKLDRMLTTPPYFTTGAYGMEIHEMTEMAQANHGQYAQSNQPVHHVLYLYNAAGRPWRTQKEVRRVMDEMYTPELFPGDEDNGEMSAWYVLSALGIFPLTPGRAEWTIGAPLFPSATVQLPNGEALVIEADGEGPYVSDLSYNGKQVDRLFLTHDEVAGGGRLIFQMSTAAKERVVPAEGRPYSMTPYEGTI